MVHDFPKCFKCWEEYCEFVNFHHSLISSRMIEPFVLYSVFDDGKETTYHILDDSYANMSQNEAKVFEVLRNDPDLLSKMEVWEGGVIWTDSIGLASETLYHHGKEIKAPTKPPLS